MLGEPVAMPSGEEGEEYDYEGADFGASLEPIDEEGGEGGEDRFFGLKCVKFAGVSLWFDENFSGLSLDHFFPSNGT